jgi:hypothetical protein
MNSEKPTLYVTKTVKDSRVFEAVKTRVEESGAATVVVGSTKGKSAIQLSEALGGEASVVSVTEFTYSDDVKKAMKKLKIAAVEKADLPIQDNREMRETLMMFGPGVKAALEVAAIAVSRGPGHGYPRVQRTPREGGHLGPAQADAGQRGHRPQRLLRGRVVWERQQDHRRLHGGDQGEA